MSTDSVMNILECRNSVHHVFVCFRAVFILHAMGFLGCATPTTATVETRQTLNPDVESSVVVLPIDQSSRLDEKITHCVEKEIANSGKSTERFVERERFLSALFPWFEFEPIFVERNLDDLRAIVMQPIVKSRLASIGVRYLAYVGLLDSEKNALPGMLCSPGPPAAGCLGIYASKDKTTIRMFVWDIHQGIETGDMETTSAGTTFIPALILPFPFIAYTEDDACKKLASVLQGAFAVDPQ